MRKYILLTLIPVLGLLSCKSFLEPYSPSEYTPETAAQLDEVLLGNAYPTPSTTKTLISLLDIASDDVVCINYLSSAATSGYYATSRTQAIGFMYSWQPQFSTLMVGAGYNTNNSNLYSNHYDFIAGANAALEYLDRVSGTVDEKNWVRAQGLALRGLLYLQLVNIYGAPYNLGRNGIGVPLKIVSGLEQREMVRNTVGEIYDQIISDLLEAEATFELLSDNRQFSPNFRINLPAVRLILARAYLYMEEWESAAEYAGKVISDDRFSLLNLNTLPLGDLVWTSSNFSRTYFNFFSYDNPETIWAFSNSYYETYLSQYRLGGSISTPTLLVASPELVNSFIPEPLQGENAYQNTPDLRLYQYLVQERHTSMAIVPTRFRTYGKMAVNSGSSNNAPISSGDTFAQGLRLAEAYIIAAEAHAMLYKEGDGAALAESLRLMNLLRRNRYLTGDQYITLSTSDADELIEFARNERRCEMCVEGLRWFDLRRWGMPEIVRTLSLGEADVATYRLEQGDPSYIFPIPHQVMEANTSMTQAPLYNEGNTRQPIQ